MNDLRLAVRQLRKSFLSASGLVLAAVAPLSGAQNPVAIFPFKRDGQLMLVEVSIDGFLRDGHHASTR